MKIIIPSYSRRTKGLQRWLMARLRFAQRKRVMNLRAERDVMRKREDRLRLVCIGMLTVAWANLERGIDGLVALVAQNGGAEAVQAALPVSFGPKLDYLKKARAQLPYLAPFVERMRAFQTEAKRLKAVRADLLHGVVEETDEMLIWSADRLSFSGATAVPVITNYDVDDVTGASTQIIALLKECFALTAEIRADLNAAKAPNLDDKLAIG